MRTRKNMGKNGVWPHIHEAILISLIFIYYYFEWYFTVYNGMKYMQKDNRKSHFRSFYQKVSLRWLFTVLPCWPGPKILI